MSGLVIIALLFAVVLAFFLLHGWSLLRHRKWIRAGIYTVPLALLFSIFIVVLLVISNLMTYHRLTHEREIISLSISETSAQEFQVQLSYLSSGDDRSPEQYAIAGDEWQLEARILKWHGWANLLGLDSYYQLDRIRGRFQDVTQESKRSPTVYALSKDERGINLWGLKQLMKSKLPFYDAIYGQAVFLPLKHGAEFRISINQSGLIARPVNDIAKQAIDRW